MGFLLTLLGLGAVAALAALSSSAPAGGAPAQASTAPDPEMIRQFLASNPTAEQIVTVAAHLRGAGYPAAADALMEAGRARGFDMTTPAERPAVPGEPLPPPPPPGTPQPAATEEPLPLRPGDDTRPAPAPASPDGMTITPAERAQLALLPPDVSAELAQYISARPTDANTRAVVLNAASAVARGGTTYSASQRAQAAELLTGYGLTQTAAWLRSVPAATPEQAAPPATPPHGATPPVAPAAPPTSTARAGHAVRTAAYNEASARSNAPRIASDLKLRSRNYNREALAEFQRSAGILADGLYGGETRGALVYYGVHDAPGALFRPTATVRYVPAPPA